jgi:hypothetical protein
MSDAQDLRIAPAVPSGVVEPSRPALPQRPAPAASKRREGGDEPVAASTGGRLRSAYAEFVIDSETRSVVLHIRDAATNRIIQELPSPEVQSIMRSLHDYAEMLARRRAATPALEA